MRQYTYAEIKQSRIISEKKAPRFGLMIIVFMVIFMAALLTASAFITKPYVVSYNGVIKGEEVTLVTNKVTGAISNIAVENGETVSIGDLLYEIDTTDIDLLIAKAEQEKQYIDLKIDSTLLLIKYIDNYNLSQASTMVNPFIEADLNEAQEYYFAEGFSSYVTENGLTQPEVDSIKPGYLVEHYATYDSYTFDKIRVEGEISMYTESLNGYKVRATTSGTIYLNETLSIGTVVAAGSNLGNISKSNVADFYIEALVSVGEKNKLTIEDEVEVSLSGIDKIDYGTIKATVTEISNETTIIDGTVYYYITMKPETTSVTNSKGDVIEITSGMNVSCNVKYDESTWLQWALKQLGVEIK